MYVLCIHSPLSIIKSVKFMLDFFMYVPLSYYDAVKPVWLGHPLLPVSRAPRWHNYILYFESQVNKHSFK